MNEPAPAGRWIMKQEWMDLLFLNWPVPAEALRPLVPNGLQIDEAEGSAWVSVVPFWMSQARFPGLPPLPFISSFPEVNLRTYVSSGSHSGIWFISLDTQSRVNVFIARRGFHMPYFLARVSMTRGAEIAFRSVRDGGTAEVDVRYRLEGEETLPGEGSLEHFLTERYSAFGGRPGRLRRLDIRHPPWRLRRASVEIRRMDLLAAEGIDVAGREPLVFASGSTDVTLWRPVRL